MTFVAWLRFRAWPCPQKWTHSLFAGVRYMRYGTSKKPQFESNNAGDLYPSHTMTQPAESFSNQEPSGDGGMLAEQRTKPKKRPWLVEMIIGAISGEHGRMHAAWLDGMTDFVMRYARFKWHLQRADAEDVVQDVADNLRDHLPTPANGINGSIEIKKFVLAVAKNVIIDRDRRKRARPEMVPLEEDVVVRSQRRWSDAASAPHDIEIRAFIYKVLAEMPPARRTAWELCQIEGLTYSQAAARTGTAFDTVRAHVRDGNKQIREHPDAPAVLALLPEPFGNVDVGKPDSKRPNNKRTNKEEQ